MSENSLQWTRMDIGKQPSIRHSLKRGLKDVFDGFVTLSIETEDVASFALILVEHIDNGHLKMRIKGVTWLSKYLH